MAKILGGKKVLAKGWKNWRGVSERVRIKDLRITDVDIRIGVDQDVLGLVGALKSS